MSSIEANHFGFYKNVSDGKKFIIIIMISYIMKPKEGYLIPFEGKINIGQGYNSKFSHKLFKEFNFDATYSLDFTLPEGTLILAAREGIVTQVKDDSEINYGGTDQNEGQKAAEQANYIEIEHKDGSFTSYYHVKKGSSKVKIGQKVLQGYPIAKSGNTGWSTTPHLDFTAFHKNKSGFAIKTFPTKFLNYDGPLEDKAINPDSYK
jgi:murein DD-endopeptidase MepM/ murein hydrolase activator NlpD